MQLFENYSGGTEGTQFNVNASVTGVYAVAQSFIPQVTHNIAQVRFKISQSASGTGVVVADIREMEGGLPTDTSLISSFLTTTLNVADVSVNPTWYTFSFPSDSNQELLAGTTYAVSIYPSNGTGGINVRGAGSGGYAGGNAFYRSSSSWYASASADLYFEEIGTLKNGLFFCMG